MRLQIHKNDLKPFFLKDYRKPTKIGKEKFIRWIDVPEYILVEAEPLENLLNKSKYLIQKDITWHMETAPNLGHDPKNPFPLYKGINPTLHEKVKQATVDNCKKLYKKLLKSVK